MRFSPRKPTVVLVLIASFATQRLGAEFTSYEEIHRFISGSPWEWFVGSQLVRPGVNEHFPSGGQPDVTIRFSSNHGGRITTFGANGGDQSRTFSWEGLQFRLDQTPPPGWNDLYIVPDPYDGATPGPYEWVANDDPGSGGYWGLLNDSVHGANSNYSMQIETHLHDSFDWPNGIVHSHGHAYVVDP